MTDDILLTRRHRILDVRYDQLVLNLLAVRGGQPYIDARLWRAPNESDLSWTGHGAMTRTSGTVGRRQRAALVNDGGRVAGKINQYLFAEDAQRSGIDEAWARDVTGTGRSVRTFWEDVSELITAGQWCWLQVDRGAPEIDPATGRPIQRSLLDRERIGDRIRWALWPSTAVVDWSFDLAGRLRWVLTEQERYDNVDPLEVAEIRHVRTLWRAAPGGATWQQFIRGDGGAAVLTAEGTVSTPQVPFVLIGTPSDDPWWFDDAEVMQAQVLNLDSLHVENLTRTVFPQLVLPAGALSGLEARLVERMGTASGERVVEVIREIVRGLDAPIVETSEEKNITRFIQPSAADLGAIPTELMRKRQLLFDMVGLALFNKETRQVQTAEAKQFDHLDTEATLCNRALVLQEAEGRLIELSAALDPEWARYEVVWPDRFDVVDVENHGRALVEIGNVSGLTLTQRKVLLKAATRVLGQLVTVEPQDADAIDTEIEALTEDDFSARSFRDLDLGED